MKQIALRYGSWMFAGFSVLFLSMHILGLSANIWLRAFNGVIQISALWMALSMWLQQHPGDHDNYPTGVALGLMTTIVGVIPFVVFITLFLAYDPVLLSQIQAQTPLAKYFNPVTASLVLSGESIIIGLIGSYILMRIMEARKHAH